MKKFPKMIYVTREQDGTDDEYLTVREDEASGDFEVTTPVAKYQLVEVGKVIVTREYSNGTKSAR